MSRKLFLSFDFCHILKNIRNLFIDKKLVLGDKIINSTYLRQIYNTYKHQLLKPVRFLTRKHIYPSNLERMNVGRALDIFRPEVTAALRCMADDYPQNKIEIMSTVQFMEMIFKWFQVILNFTYFDLILLKYIIYRYTMYPTHITT